MDRTSIGLALAADRAEILALCASPGRSSMLLERAGACGDARDEALWRWRLASSEAGGRGLHVLVARDCGGGPVRAVLAGVALPTGILGSCRESLRVVVAHAEGPLAGPSEEARRGRERLQRLGRAWRRRVLDAEQAPISLAIVGSCEPGPCAHGLAGQRHLGGIELLEHDRLDLLADEGAAFIAAELHSPPADIERLWQTVASGTTIAVARTERYLRWRYLQHPWRRYVLVAVHGRSGGGTRGLAVLARAPGAHDAFTAVEWLVPCDDIPAAEALAGACARAILRREGKLLSVWEPARARVRRVLSTLGFHERQVALSWGGATASERLSLNHLSREAFVSLGDSEEF